MCSTCVNVMKDKLSVVSLSIYNNTKHVSVKEIKSSVDPLNLKKTLLTLGHMRKYK